MLLLNDKAHTASAAASRLPTWQYHANPMVQWGMLSRPSNSAVVARFGPYHLEIVCMMQPSNMLGRSVSDRQCAPGHVPCQHAMQRFGGMLSQVGLKDTP